MMNILIFEYKITNLFTALKIGANIWLFEFDSICQNGYPIAM